MDQNSYIIKFENASPMEKSIYAEELRNKLLDEINHIPVKRIRYSPQEQDFGSALIVMIGTSTAFTIATALKNWLDLRTNASLTLETLDKKIIVQNITSKDASKLAELLLVSQQELSQPEKFINKINFDEAISIAEKSDAPHYTSEKYFKIFFSYSYQDEELRIELEKYLISLKRQLKIESWHRGEVRAGTDWKQEIENHLIEADIILLLISQDFIASDFCFNVEMAQAVERHKKGETSVIPILLRPALWENTPFGHLQALPANLKPITLWSNRDEAFLDVARGIKKVTESLI